MGKRRKVMLLIDSDLYREFQVYALKKFYGRRDYVSAAFEEAVRLWLEQEKRAEQQSSGK